MPAVDALDRLEARWQELGVNTGSLRAGLTAAEVTATLAGFGLPAHPDLVAWFSWHNGCSEPYWSAVPTPLRPLSLDEAARLRSGYLVNFGRGGQNVELFEYLPTWVPILGAVSTDMMVLDAATGELLRVDPWNAEHPVRPTGYDLERAVAYFFEVLEVVPLEFTDGDAEINFQRLPPALHASPLL